MESLDYDFSPKIKEGEISTSKRLIDWKVIIKNNFIDTLKSEEIK